MARPNAVTVAVKREVKRSGDDVRSHSAADVEKSVGRVISPGGFWMKKPGYFAKWRRDERVGLERARDEASKASPQRAKSLNRISPAQGEIACGEGIIGGMESKEGKVLKSVANRPNLLKPVGPPTASDVIHDAKSDVGTCNDKIAENKFCSSCGKSGIPSKTLKKCTACKCVYYCDIICQKEHRRFHKEDCKLIKMVLQGRCSDVHDHSDPRLYEDPTKEVCVICMLVLPVDPALGAYMTCCGKKTCSGCLWELLSLSRRICPFCRAEAPRTDEENLVRLIKRTEVNDPNAFASLGLKYLRGLNGVSVDETVGVDFLIKAASFGSIEACCKLARMYYEGKCGLEMDKTRAARYWKLAAKGGDAESRHYLGVMEYNKNIQAAIRHWRIASEAGFRLSIVSLIAEFSKGNICHLDIADTLQARDYALNEAKSEQRDRYIKHLRDSTGNRCICHSSYKL